MLGQTKIGCNRHAETACIGKSVDDVGFKSQCGTVARQRSNALVRTGPEEFCLILIKFKMTSSQPKVHIHDTRFQCARGRGGTVAVAVKV